MVKKKKNWQLWLQELYCQKYGSNVIGFTVLHPFNWQKEWQIAARVTLTERTVQKKLLRTELKSYTEEPEVEVC